MYSTLRTSYISQIGLLLFAFGIGIILSSVVLIPLAAWQMHVPLSEISKALLLPENAGVNRWLQGLGSVLTMGLPALIFSRVMSRRPQQYLGFSSDVSGKQVFLVIWIVFAALMVGGALSMLNEHIPISKAWALKFKAMEDDYAKQIVTIAGMKNTTEYIISLFVLAFLPALTEELLFRGCLQQVMVGLTRRVFAGILITSIIFSLAHTSFYGFLPRLFLGLVLGYLFQDSKNLWLSIWAHFFNNALALTQVYALSRSGKLTPESMNDSYPLYIGLLGAGILIALFSVFRKESSRILAVREADDVLTHYNENE
jgi:membrane protease YdiL (CAAX protease family)